VVVEDDGFSPEQLRERRRLLLCIVVSLFIIQTVNMNVSTIVPNYVKDNHEKLTDTHVSLIMA
jgi:hypothetical protein